MTRKLVKTGNSNALIVDKTMKEHLGVTDEVEVIYEKDRIVLKRPMSVRDASDLSARSTERRTKSSLSK
jgi:antitoxin component of MazEF toxin-antitoxin module